MIEPQQTLEALVAELVARIEEDPACELETLLEAHPAEASELRRRIAVLRAAGLLPRGVRPTTLDPLQPIRGRLERRADFSERYLLADELGRGGMGRILEAREDDLQRTVAMKVFHPRDADGSPDPALIGRFLHEARITAQLDHPGIVPVHELGLDAGGQPYFTMRLVKGEDLRLIYEHVTNGTDGWKQPRALGVLLKVCEALGYAHEKGIIHRDLKPANVMVGKHGEVYVMDWGLARVLGERDPFDLRLRPESEGGPNETPAGSPAREHASDSPLVTRNGDIVGTPAYMPPEQARGELAALGPQSDVYAVGAMIYQLAAGRMPFVARDELPSPRAILRRVLAGPPESLASLAPQTPPELVAICEKAMAREPAERYADTRALAEDLRAFLELRMVRAYRTGTWIEARKWMQRNRGLALALLAFVASLTGGALAFKLKADQAARTAREVLSLSAIQDLRALEQRADALWPATAERVDAYREWLEDADALVEGRAPDPTRGRPERLGLGQYESQLAELRRRALPAPHESREIVSTAPEPEGPRTFVFDQREDQWWHDQLSGLVSGLSLLRAESSGGLASAGISREHGWGIRRRLGFALNIAERSLASPQASKLWSEAIDAISRVPAYHGLQLAPQSGLLPIGPDPESGLWEFAHLQSGAVARRKQDGSLDLQPEMGLVLVLLPGGRFWMGAQREDGAGQNFDPEARTDECPVHEVVLSPFFLSKFEITQGQWERLSGENPSVFAPWHYSPAWDADRKGWTALHPVEHVSANQCKRMLFWIGLQLPTEAQWEYACRAGTTSPYACGERLACLQGNANLSDAFAKSHAEEPWKDRTSEPSIDDGHAVHAEVGSLRANRLGLHDMQGNVGELCRDRYVERAYAGTATENPVVPQSSTSGFVTRGGSFCDSATQARCAIRNYVDREYRGYDLGLRPALELQTPITMK